MSRYKRRREVASERHRERRHVPRWLRSGCVLGAAVVAAAVGCRAGRAADAKLSPADQKILDSLQKPIRIEFDKTSLQEVVTSIQAARGIEIRLDQPAFRAAGIKPDTPVTGRFVDFTLQSALRLLLSDLGLTHVVSHGALVITTEAAGEQLLWRGAFDPAVLRSPQAVEAAKKIAAKLREPVSQGFIETPLNQIVEYLRDQFEIPIHIDQRGLAGTRVAADVPCIIEFKGLTLESALGNLVRQKRLTYVVEDEYVLITATKKDREPARPRLAPAGK